MARRSLSSFMMLWSRHKQIYSEMFSAALLNLTEMDSVSGDEDAISEILSLVLTEVSPFFQQFLDQIIYF
jgi:hypothetical protein